MLLFCYEVVAFFGVASWRCLLSELNLDATTSSLNGNSLMWLFILIVQRFPYSPTEGVGDTASCINQSLPCKNGKRSSFICATLITVLLGI